MKMKTRLKGAVVENGKLRAWTGVAAGAGIGLASMRLMPDFPTLTNELLYPLPYLVPGVAVGTALLISPKTRNAGYGMLGTQLALYFYATLTGTMEGRTLPNEAQQTTGAIYATGLRGAPVQILGR